MNPSIVNNRARTVQGSDGKAQPTTSSRVSRPNSVDCIHPTWFACCAPDFQGRIETLGKVGRPRKSAEFREMLNKRFSLNLGFEKICNAERNERVCTPHKQLG